MACFKKIEISAGSSPHLSYFFWNVWASRKRNILVIELYMAVGGVPHYLSFIERGKPVVQNIEDLCFAKGGILRTEFEHLFSSLFDNPAPTRTS